MTHSVFTESERRQLAERTKGLHERIDGSPPEKAAADSEVGVTMIDEWFDSFVNDEVSFIRRLDLDGYSLDDCHRMLSAHTIREEGMPDWVDYVSDLVKHVIITDLKPISEDDSDQRPFVEISALLADYAITQIDWEEYPLVGPGAVNDAKREIHDRLQQVVTNPLYAWFVSYQKNNDNSNDYAFVGQRSTRADGERTVLYDGYISYLKEGGFKEFLLEYPVIGKLIIDVIVNWLESFTEFLDRLHSDSDDLESFVSGLTEDGVIGIEFVGDRHEGGRTTVRIETKEGDQVAYKPRTIAPGRAFNKFLEWVNKESPLPKLWTTSFLDRGNYGWMEWIEQNPCASTKDVDLYYKRAGVLLAVLYALRFTDGHIENLIAHGAYPVVIDLETVADPGNTNRPRSEDVAPIIDESILRTGVLPIHTEDGISGVAGLSRKKAEITKKHEPTYTNVNSDDMDVFFGTTMEVKGKSLPHVDGEPHYPSDHTLAIRDGFCAGYEFLLENRTRLLEDEEPLASFAEIQCRLIFRPTRTYGQVLQRLRRPKHLRDGNSFELGIERLTESFVNGTLKEELWPIYEAERETICQFDIPRLTINSSDTTVYHRGDPIAEGVLETTPLQQIRDRIRTLNEDDLKEQVDYIRLAYKSESFLPFDQEAVGDRLSENSTDLGDAPYRDVILSAVGRILDGMVEGTDEPTWILRRKYDEHGLRVMTAKPGFYEGRLGIAFALAGAAKVLDAQLYENLAVKIAMTAIEDRPNDSNEYAEIGAGPGLGGDMYALTKIGELAESEECIDAAASLAESVSESTIEDDNSLDLLRGAAGYVLGAATVYERTGADAALETAVAAGERLQDAAVDTERGPRWRTTSSDRIFEGFIHGTTGIGYALARLSEVSGTDSFHETAIRALRTVPVTREGFGDFEVYPSVEDGNGYVKGWANGITGVGLGLVGIHDAAPEEQIYELLEASLDTVDPDYRLVGADLLRGDAGRIEWFDEAGSVTGDRSLNETADRHADGLVRHYETYGSHNLPWQTPRWTNPSLFNGLGGVAYTFARRIDSGLPNPLLWE